MHVPSLTSGMARIRLCFWLAALLTAGVWAALLVRAHQASRTPGAQAVPGQALMGGMALTNTPAPDFTLTNQFGQPVSLRQYRGKVVFLAFVDSQCTTICPLTTQSLVDARSSWGRRPVRWRCSASTPTPRPRRSPTCGPTRRHTGCCSAGTSHRVTRAAPGRLASLSRRDTDRRRDDRPYAGPLRARPAGTGPLPLPNAHAIRRAAARGGDPGR